MVFISEENAKKHILWKQERWTKKNAGRSIRESPLFEGLQGIGFSGPMHKELRENIGHAKALCDAISYLIDQEFQEEEPSILLIEHWEEELERETYCLARLKIIASLFVV